MGFFLPLAASRPGCWVQRGCRLPLLSSLRVVVYRICRFSERASAPCELGLGDWTAAYTLTAIELRANASTLVFNTACMS